VKRESFGKACLAIAALVLVLAFAFQGSRGLWEPDEGRYVRCAYEMQKTGDWLTPQIGYRPHFTKPPVTYWLIASGLSLFGKNEWGARLFHGLAFALTALIVGLMGKRMWDRQTGLVACLMYATTAAPFFVANIISTDTILTFFEVLAVACYWMSVTDRERILQSSLWALAMYAVFGVAFLTKGPAGLLPLVAIIAYALLVKRRKRLPTLVTLAGALICIAVSVSWFLMVVRVHEGLLSYFWNQEFIGRNFTAAHGRNPGLLHLLRVYLPVLTVGVLPWSAFWPRIIRRSRPAVLTLDWWRGLLDRPIALFLVLWLTVPLFIFCLSSSKLPLYMLSLIAPLVLATARALVIQFPEKISDALRFRGEPGTAVAALVLVLVGAKLVMAHVPHKRDSRALWNGVREVIEERVGDRPCEIVLIGSKYNGLAFYSDTNLRLTKTGKGASTSYSPIDYVGDEFDALLSSRYVHVFFVKDNRVDFVSSELEKRGVGYSVSEAPFEHVLIICDPPEPDGESVTLAALGGVGARDPAQSSIASTLYHVDHDTSFDGIILLDNDIAGGKRKGEFKRSYRKYFEKSFSPLLDNEVLFYATLGSHEPRDPSVDFQINYPLFNMKERRYYSKAFGLNIA